MKFWPMLTDSVSWPVMDGDPFWEPYLKRLHNGNGHHVSIHLAILREPYLTMILEGEKTIESRLSMYRQIPYQKISEGDIVWLKRSGGPVTGLGYVVKVEFYEQENGLVEFVRDEFEDELGIEDSDFWEKRKNASYASLIRLAHVREVEPFKYHKKDQRAWVILHSAL